MRILAVADPGDVERRLAVGAGIYALSRSRWRRRREIGIRAPLVPTLPASGRICARRAGQLGLGTSSFGRVGRSLVDHRRAHCSRGQAS